ncbi:MAG: hypothetical protein COC01_03885 [Bacteroidetes bacterium]|nr:MAG: hypothetical protein COC01_03885 [Bacteroidota bacterium]
MIRKFLFLSIITLFYFCPGYCQINETDANGLRQGHWVIKYDTDTIKEDIFYKDSIRIGEYKAYDYEGNLRVIGQYENGLKDGLWNTYYPNDQLRSEVFYINDKKEGVYKTYYKIEDDLVLSSGEQKLILQNLGFFKNDIKHSNWTQYYRSGKIKLVSTFKKGRLHGKWFGYYENGQAKNVGKYKKGNLHGWHYDYLDNGILFNKSKYRQGWLNGKTEKYTFDGKLKNIRYYRNDKLHGKYKNFYTDLETNQLSEDKKYRRGEIHGVQKFYRKSGWMIAKVLYKKGKMIRRIDTPVDTWDINPKK